MRPQAPPRTRRTQQERVAISTQRLLEAAISLIGEKGFERTTAVEISERAGYSKPMVHVRFGSKEALLETLLTSYQDQILPAPDPTRDGLERVLDGVEAMGRRAAEDPALLRTYFMLGFEALGPASTRHPWLKVWLARFEAQTLEAMRAGQTDGSVRPDLDPELETRALMDLMTGPVFRWTLDAERTDLPAELHACRHRLRSRLAVLEQ